ncbi:hypothetical protein WJX84_009062 [Apatococcus fuscideae]|uniref:SAM domain-containing protein n=1 Tax=Apatococcus fuscideae TaxID=2026836 RepID=A0AAW1TGJ8_9CHLO
MSGKRLQGSAGHSGTLPDDSAIFAARLFAPFALDETDFPLHCAATVLSSMLSEPPAASVPVPQSLLSQCNAKWTDRQHPLFEQERDTSAPALVPMLHTAVCHAVPRGRPSKLLMTLFWNAIGMAFPEQIGQLLGLDIVIDRNVEEMTITERLLKRDYMCKLEYRPCIVGEDKSNPSQQQEAVQDAVDKYRTVNAVTYGRLGYILMVTMAGSWMAVHGMPLIANLQTEDLIPLIRPFEIVSPFGRTKAVTTAINLTRWILTVGKLRFLPPVPAADLNEALVRPSPYLGADPLAQPGKLTIHLGYVDKTVCVPSAHLQALLSVYGLLKAKKIPNAISCRWLHVGGHRAERFVRARSHSASLLSSATCPDTARSKTAVHEICATSDLVLLLTQAAWDRAQPSSRFMSLGEAICGWELSDEAAEKLRAWLTHEDQGYQLDAPIDEGLLRLTDLNFQQAGLTQLRQRNLVLAKLSHAGKRRRVVDSSDDDEEHVTKRSKRDADVEDRLRVLEKVLKQSSQMSNASEGEVIEVLRAEVRDEDALEGPPDNFLCDGLDPFRMQDYQQEADTYEPFKERLEDSLAQARMPRQAVYNMLQMLREASKDPLFRLERHKDDPKLDQQAAASLQHLRQIDKMGVLVLNASFKNDKW